MNRSRLIALSLALLTLVVYLPVGWHDFVVIDDSLYITGNHHVLKGLTWDNVRWAFTNFDAGFYHPLTWLSLMLDCELFGLNAGAHHMVSVLLHMASTVLLYKVLWRATGGMWRSALVAALFALHPLHVESVAWAAERKDTLSTLFWMLTLLAYIHYAEQVRERSGKAWTWYVGVVVLFICGLMSKTTLVTLPVVLFLVDFWPLGRLRLDAEGKTHWLRLVIEKLPLLAAAFIFGFLTISAEKSVGALPSTAHFPMFERVENASLSTIHYLWQMVWPTKMTVFYPYPKSFSGGLVVLAVLLIGAISWVAIRWGMKRPWFLVGWFWYGITLAPLSGLIQVGAHSRADRYTYVQLIGVFIILAWGADEFFTRRGISKKTMSFTAAAVLLGCIGVTEHQLSFWENDKTLFGHALAVTQDNDVALINYGSVLEQEGQPEEALKYYRAALVANTNSTEAHVNIGVYYDKAGNLDEAMAQYNAALELWPEAPIAHMDLGGLLVKLGKFDEAIGHYEVAAKADAGDPRPHYLMGKARLRQGDSAAAITNFNEALKLDGNDYQSLLWLARVRAADEDAAMRNGTEAVAAAERVNGLTGGSDPAVLDVLAMAYAEAGRFEDAMQAEQSAIKLMGTNGPEAVATMGEHLQLYKGGKAYREDFRQP